MLLSSPKLLLEGSVPHNMFSIIKNVSKSTLARTVLAIVSLVSTSSVLAEEYYWRQVHDQRGLTYASALSACADYADHVQYFDTMMRLNDGAYSCRTVRRSDGYVGWATVERRGDVCPPDTKDNVVIGGCESIQGAVDRKQKGDPRSDENNPASCAGNPINFAIGNKYQAEVDYSSPIDNPASFPLSFLRYYNSLDGVWQHSYATRLMIGTKSIALIYADGRQSLFAHVNDMATAETTERGHLTKTPDNWVYASINGETLTFDSQGRLVRWQQSGGAVQTLVYSANQITVTDSFGQTLVLVQDHRYQPLTVNVGDTTIRYSYNGYGRLITATRTRAGQSAQRQFHYEDTHDTKLLTGITDEQGIRFATWSYDAQGRAISSEHAGGTEKVLVSYNADSSSTVTNELGKKATYRFQTIEGVKRITAIEGEPSPNCPSSNSSYVYNARGQVERKTDNKGNVTTYSYNERGQEISRTEAYGTPQARTITTEWHPSLFLPLTVTEPGRVTRYQYDDQGRLLGRTAIDR